MGAGLMHTGYYFGFFLAALANHFVGETHGWRPCSSIGGIPALVIGFVMYAREGTGPLAGDCEEDHRSPFSDDFQFKAIAAARC